ncbi:MAG: hypothetical protein Q8L29_01230 [archaeon]|nr:hypothetical protein [archaeon]
MAGYHSMYGGADYGLNPDYGKDFGQSIEYTGVSDFALSTDPRTANQIKAVAEKIRAGAKGVEIEMLLPDVIKAIPKQHLEELNRLRKVAGVDLTLHGPTIEPTGVTRNGWDEVQRVNAEREMWDTVERSHAIQPNGNMVITFHTSAGIPDPEIIEKVKDKEVLKNIAIIDERTGRLGYIPQDMLQKEYFEGKGEPANPINKLTELNENAWRRELNELALATDRGRQEIERAMMSEKPMTPEQEKKVYGMYSTYLENPVKYESEMKKIKQEMPELAHMISNFTHGINSGTVFLENAYESFRELYNRAYSAAERDKDEATKKKLDEFKERVAPVIKKFREDPTKKFETANELSKGINLLGNEIDAPKMFRPLKEFALDKASETFSNIALKAYNKFKENAPIIALENPPVGMGITRGKDIRELVEKTQEKLRDKLQEEGLSKSAAEKEAKKLIGVTWDVGHINMLKKHGYTDEDLRKETGQIAKYVKKIHLSDNFGFEHSELPMGMGNVPMQKHMEELKKAHGEQLKKIKKVIEAGDWYQHFQTTPFSVNGSALYAMQMAPYWGGQSASAGSYFTSYGMMNPEIHHSQYGAGFSTLPAELGGQIAGKSRLSGSAMD